MFHIFLSAIKPTESAEWYQRTSGYYLRARSGPYRRAARPCRPGRWQAPRLTKQRHQTQIEKCLQEFQRR